MVRKFVAIISDAHSTPNINLCLINEFWDLLAYVLGELLQLLAALPPGDQGRGLRSGALALHVVGAIRRYEPILGENVHGNGFHWKKSH